MAWALPDAGWDLGHAHTQCMKDLATVPRFANHEVAAVAALEALVLRDILEVIELGLGVSDREGAHCKRSVIIAEREEEQGALFVYEELRIGWYERG